MKTKQVTSHSFSWSWNTTYSDTFNNHFDLYSHTSELAWAGTWSVRVTTIVYGWLGTIEVRGKNLYDGISQFQPGSSATGTLRNQ